MFDMRPWIDLCSLSEGRVYQLDVGYSRPVTITTNPSKAQASTIVETMRSRHGMVYLRGLVVATWNKTALRHTVYLWDGMMMTHDDVRGELFPDMSNNSGDLTAFEIANYTHDGLGRITMHDAKIRLLKAGMSNPETNPFVRNVVAAIDENRSS